MKSKYVSFASLSSTISK